MSDLELESNAAPARQPSEAYSLLDTFRHAYDRGVGTTDGHPSYTVDQAGAQIDRYGYQFRDKDGDGAVVLSYSFTEVRPADFDSSRGDFIAFNDQQRAQTKLALQAWADVANVKFTQALTGGDGHLSLASYSTSASEAAYAFYPNGTSREGQSWYWVSDSYQDNANAATNNYGGQTLLHEIGHTLGLGHPGDYNAWDGVLSYGDDAPYAQDSRGYSVMSYWDEFNTHQDFHNAYASAPLMDDIAAIQQLYGANLQTRSGGTVYGFNANSNRAETMATTDHDTLIFSVWDTGGIDTLDFSGYSMDQRINLQATSFSDVGGLIGNVSIAQGVIIEKAFGGAGNDYLIGNDAANELKGNEGNDLIAGAGGADKLWGGAGADTFVYTAREDSAKGGSDRLMDFTTGEDRIDLSALAGDGGQAIHFAATLDGTAGAAVLKDTGYGTRLAVDFDGDHGADFVIRILGEAHVTDVVV
ncbi:MULTISPECIES: serralysin family metalloprotease [Pseudomonas]|uniref:Serralysin family metalloprotease n=1 Tax=Pseudomonas quercus TaxID=2722792 RepID=A0ABX0Y995_9PSED|nr:MULTISPECIES: serralysin family metalloprotease [Pseudomonas]MBF7141298.1 M10 family metallopeptidase [Pseudomonas sp. LY10J]NJO99831.1 serralysin family metalloprotease [Pseudomonas quercus]